MVGRGGRYQAKATCQVHIEYITVLTVCIQLQLGTSVYFIWGDLSSRDIVEGSIGVV